MVAADPRIEYLSGTDGAWRNELHGILKKRGAPEWGAPLFFCNLGSGPTNTIHPHFGVSVHVLSL